MKNLQESRSKFTLSLQLSTTPCTITGLGGVEIHSHAFPRPGIYREAVCFKPHSLHTLGKSPLYQFDGRSDGPGISVGNGQWQKKHWCSHQESKFDLSGFGLALCWDNSAHPLQAVRGTYPITTSAHLFPPHSFRTTPRSELQKLVCVNNGAGKH